MGTTADKLNHLINTKEGIRQEINRAYGTEEVSTSDTFNSYIQKLEEHPYYIMRYIERSIESIKLSNVTSIGEGAFRGCSGLTEVSIPNATSIGNNAFYYCSSLTSVSIPGATSIGDYAFHNCRKLTSVSIPGATSIGQFAFYDCRSLTSASFPEVTSIDVYAFNSCSALTTLYIGTESNTVCTLSNTNAIPSSVTDIYVPKALVNSYKTASVWKYIADKIKAYKGV